MLFAAGGFHGGTRAFLSRPLPGASSADPGQRAGTTRRRAVASRRAGLAYGRTLLANERTYAAWLRTGLAGAAVGLAVAHLAELPGSGRSLAAPFGGGFVLVGIGIIAFGAWRFTRVNRDLAEAGSPATAVPAWIVHAVTVVMAALLFGVLALL
ncbi:MAG TPA: DUF202 domain-containing protein [Longimicrobium sp.]|nr:DUF202 domain-containing protein [Longimicrobium sp.]